MRRVRRVERSRGHPALLADMRSFNQTAADRQEELKAVPRKPERHGQDLPCC